MTTKELVEALLAAYDSGRISGQPTYDTYYKSEVVKDILDSLKDHLTADEVTAVKAELEKLPEEWA